MPVHTIRSGSGTQLVKIIGTQERAGVLVYEVLPRFGRKWGRKPKLVTAADFMGTPGWVNDVALRQKLDDVTEIPEDQWRARYAVVAAAQQIGLSVVDDPAVPDIRKCTCFMYALNLATNETHRHISGTCKDVFAGPEFFAFLRDQGIVRRVFRFEDALVLYFHGGKATHIGEMISGGRVRSKWGTGLILEHEVLHVPIRYGDTVQLYSRLTEQEAENAFVAYAKHCGVPLAQA